MPAPLPSRLSPFLTAVQGLAAVAGSSLSDPASRARLAQDAELSLLSDFPASRAMPASLRRQLIDEAIASLPGIAGPAASASAFEPVVAMSVDRLAVAGDTAPGNSIPGFLVDGESADPVPVKNAVREILGDGWEILAEEADGTSFTVRHPASILSVKEAWDLAHRLEDHPGISLAEPIIEWVPAPPEIGGQGVNVAASIAGLSGNKHLSCSVDPSWSAFGELKADQAWALTAVGRKQGVGIKIAHLDTGLTDHALLPLKDKRILLDRGANLYDPEHPLVGHRPLDPMDASWDDFLRTWFLAQNGHGTGTLSVLLSQGGQVHGTSPQVTVVPFRIGPTVVHWNVQRMTEGIRRAHAEGCDVITMSMGGPPSRTGGLEKAVKKAAEDGVIFCSAAGNVIGSNNFTPLVVWPAALDQVIAVGGSNCRREVWDGSSRGPEVNISAPAQDIWRASGLRGALPGSNIQGTETGRGEGTSFATPATAGIAACWLAHHGGRPAIGAHYGHVRYVPLAFAYLLRNTAYNRPNKWRTDLLGPGILDAAKLLAAPLPPKAALTGWPVKKHSLTSDVLAGIFRAWHWLTGGTPAIASAGVPDEEAFVQRYGSELVYLLYDRPALLQALAEAGLLEERPEDLAAGIAAATAGPDDGTLTAAAEALASLKRLASPSLAAALP